MNKYKHIYEYGYKQIDLDKDSEDICNAFLDIEEAKDILTNGIK